MAASKFSDVSFETRDAAEAWALAKARRRLSATERRQPAG
jgi:hypothetical protein